MELSTPLSQRWDGDHLDRWRDADPIGVTVLPMQFLVGGNNDATGAFLLVRYNAMDLR